MVTDLTLEDPFTVPTEFWHRIDDGRIQCDLCPRACRLREGQRGLCFVRGRINDQVVLTSYGRSSGFCVDPIEKKPLHHVHPGTSVLSFGTAGCNLACRFCQNWDITRSRQTHTLAAAASPDYLAEQARALGCQSVAFTYNDPVVFVEYAADVAAACRELGITTVAVSAGYVEQRPREVLFQHIDAANIDLKAFTDEFYRGLTAGRLAPVLRTLEFLATTDVWFEVTTLLIPGHNDSVAEVSAECAWIAEHLGPDVPLHFTSFSPSYHMTDVPGTPGATLLRARDIAAEHGLRYVYLGNVRRPAEQTTWCPGCGCPVIGRTGYSVDGYRLASPERAGASPAGPAHCGECGYQIPGLFGAGPGSWGARRQPVVMNDPIAPGEGRHDRRRPASGPQSGHPGGHPPAIRDPRGARDPEDGQAATSDAEGAR